MAGVGTLGVLEEAGDERMGGGGGSALSPPQADPADKGDEHSRRACRTAASLHECVRT